MLRLLHNARSYATKRVSPRLSAATRVSQSFQPMQEVPISATLQATKRDEPEQTRTPSQVDATRQQHHQRRSGWRPWLADILWTIRCMTALGIVLHLFLSNVYSISGPFGASMLPTMRVEGEWIILKRWHRRGRGCKVGDLVTFDHPILSADGVGALKRIIGMPGDFVLCETPTHSDKMIQVPAGHCFVAGDNQLHSRDSRHFGPLPLALINGKVTARILPWGRRGWFKDPLTPV